MVMPTMEAVMLRGSMATRIAIFSQSNETEAAKEWVTTTIKCFERGVGRLQFSQ
jgi:hypothetical protein